MAQIKVNFIIDENVKRKMEHGMTISIGRYKIWTSTNVWSSINRYFYA